MTVEKNEELESLRLRIRVLTSEIMSKTQERTEVARQIGEVKGRLGSRNTGRWAGQGS